MNDKTVIALGFFDGVHIGHGALLRRTREVASSLGGTACVYSFDTHPDTLVFGAEVPLLNTMAEREYLMKTLYGIDRVIFAHFDKAMMTMPWEDFVDKILLAGLHAAHIVCGHDFCFGNRGEGTAFRLQEKCHSLQIGCDIIPEVQLNGETVSSTAIRRYLSDGSLAKANAMLGHPHLLSGIVAQGNHLGRLLGFPTANVPLSSGLLVPAAGVYHAEAEIDGEHFPSLVNIGVHPTVGALPQAQAEAYLQDFRGELYGKQMLLRLLRFCRPEQKFSSVQELQSQIQKDLNKFIKN